MANHMEAAWSFTPVARLLFTLREGKGGGGVERDWGGAGMAGRRRDGRRPSRGAPLRCRHCSQRRGTTTPGSRRALTAGRPGLQRAPGRRTGRSRTAAWPGFSTTCAASALTAQTPECGGTRGERRAGTSAMSSAAKSPPSSLPGSRIATPASYLVQPRGTGDHLDRLHLSFSGRAIPASGGPCRRQRGARFQRRQPIGLVLLHSAGRSDAALLTKGERQEVESRRPQKGRRQPARPHVPAWPRPPPGHLPCPSARSCKSQRGSSSGGR